MLLLCLCCFFLQANNTMLVNSIRVPDSDIMATNGVIHFVDNVLYPGGMISGETLSVLSNCFKYKSQLTSFVFHSDIPVGNQDFHRLLKRLVSYMQLKVRCWFWPIFHYNLYVGAILLLFLIVIIFIFQYISGFKYQEIPLTFLSKS